MTAAPAPDPAEPFDAYEWAVGWILDREGGYVNDPDDKGGATNRGITQATYNTWRKSKGLPIAPVRELGLAETKLIYRRDYWDAVRGDEVAAVSAKMALCVFDCAVQSSPTVAARTFQRVAQAEPDGVIGKVSLACFRIRRQRVSEPLLLETFMDRRRGFYAAIVLRDPTQRKFANGWRNRRNSLRQMIGLEPEDS